MLSRDQVAVFSIDNSNISRMAIITQDRKKQDEVSRAHDDVTIYVTSRCSRRQLPVMSRLT